MDVETWAARGACRGLDAETFFEVDDFVDGHMTRSEAKTENAERRLRAKMICSSCPVRRQCLDAALADDDEFSVRGGATPLERRALRGGQPMAPGYGYRINPRQVPVARRGFEMVRRFASGESVASLMRFYGLHRQTVLQDLRLHLVLGQWWQDSVNDRAA